MYQVFLFVFFFCLTMLQQVLFVQRVKVQICHVYMFSNHYRKLKVNNNLCNKITFSQVHEMT